MVLISLVENFLLGFFMIKTYFALFFFTCSLFALDITYQELTSIESSIKAEQQHVFGHKILTTKDSFGKKYIVIHDLFNKDKTQEIINKKQKKRIKQIESQEQIEIANKIIVQVGFINENLIYINYEDNLIEIYDITQKNSEPIYLNSRFKVKKMLISSNNLFILYENITLTKYDTQTKEVIKYDLKDVIHRFGDKISYNKSYIVNADFDVSNDQEKIIFADHESKLYLLINILTNQVNDLSRVIDKKAIKDIKFAAKNYSPSKQIIRCTLDNNDLFAYSANLITQNDSSYCLFENDEQIKICSKNKIILANGYKASLSDNDLSLTCDNQNAVIQDLTTAYIIFKLILEPNENLFLSQNGIYLFRQTDKVIKIYTLPTREEINFYFNTQDFMNKTKKSKQDLAKILSSYLDNLANFTLTSTPQ